MIKTPWEQDVLRKLYQATCRGYLKAVEMARAGVNEKKLFYTMMETWMEEGIIDSIYTMEVLQTSRNIATSFYEDHILEKGDYIFLDGGPSYKEYEADCQRQIWIGDVGREASKWAYAAEITHIEIEDLLKPGTKCGELWQKGHEVLARYLGDWIWKHIRSPQWIGWVGHSVGLQLHEPPYIVENGEEELEEGMVINLEYPAFDVEKRVFWNMPENTYIITKNGFENLTLDLGPNGIYVKT
jgi:Xaa-Pro aminopeptidase